MADPAKIYFYHILALLLTGKNEIVMNTAFGVNLHDYVFTDLTPIKQAQVASAVTTAIETYIPEVEVMSVLPEVSKNDEGLESTLLINITYRVAGQQITQQIPISPTMQGL
jgi:phage baseplate assembly protein W